MKDSNINNSSVCEFEGDLAGYIYNEISEGESREIGRHIAACSACAAEMASISAAMTSVREWRDAEFAALPTPRVNLPAAQVSHGPTWVEMLRALILHPAALSAAAVAIVGAAVILFTQFQSAPSEMAIANGSKHVPTAGVGSTPTQPDRSVVADPKVPVETPTAEKSVAATPGPVRGAARRVSKPSPVRRSRGGVTEGSVAVRRGTLPELTEFSEVEDETLRLAELLAELDVS